MSHELRNAELDALFQQLKDLNLVTMKLQCDSNTIPNVRALSNDVIENFPGFFNRLSSTSTVVESALFVSEIAKVNC